MRQSSIALAAMASLTLFDIAKVTATNSSSDRPMVVNCFPPAEAGAATNTDTETDIKILTKDEAEIFRSYDQFGCANNPTSTVYV
jgi:hypothetical protein